MRSRYPWTLECQVDDTALPYPTSALKTDMNGESRARLLGCRSNDGSFYTEGNKSEVTVVQDIVIENPFTDPAPGIRVGDWVQAKEPINDPEGFVAAYRGNIGEVVRKDYDPVLGWCLPTVRFEHTGAEYDVTPEEVDVIAPPDFATREETTPKKPLTVAIRRGAQ
jgi:hypothetical protein